MNAETFETLQNDPTPLPPVSAQAISELIADIKNEVDQACEDAEEMLDDCEAGNVQAARLERLLYALNEVGRTLAALK